ncbi:unnamed protein product [Chrysoparadoxa australica]
MKGEGPRLVTGFDVTYGAALAPPAFHRITTCDGGSANLNAGAGSGALQTFLWYQKDGESPVVDVQVVHDDEPTPPGFERVARDLAKGSDSEHSIYLCFKCSGSRLASNGTGLAPIGEVVIAYGLDKPPGTGWESMKGSLAPAERDENVVLWYKRLQKESPRSGGASGIGLQEHAWHVTKAELQLLEDRIRGVLQNELQGDQVSSFMEGDLPAFVERCMSSSFSSAGMLPHVNTVLQLLLEVVVRWLHCAERRGDVSSSVLQMLGRLGGIDQRCSYYYRNYGTSAHLANLNLADAKGSDDTDSSQAKEEFLHVPAGAGGYDASRLYVTNMNHFGETGGFGAILKRLTPIRLQNGAMEGAPASLEELAAYVSFLYRARGLFVPAFMCKFFAEFRARAFERLDQLSPEELKEVKDANTYEADPVGSLLRDLIKLLTVVMPEGFVAEEALEKAQLSLSLQLLECPFLNPRIKGIALLNDIVEMTMRRETYRHGGYSMVAQLPVAAWLQPDWLAKWLNEKQVVEVLLGGTGSGSGSGAGGKSWGKVRKKQGGLDANGGTSSPRSTEVHIEILKRCEGVLGFLTLHRYFGEAEIDLLWAAAEGESDAQKRAVYNLMVSLAPKLSADGKSQLYQKLRSLTEELEVAQIMLVKGFAAAVLASLPGPSGLDDQDEEEQALLPNPEVNFAWGLDMLWETAISTNVSPDITDQASLAIASLLSHAGNLDAAQLQHSPTTSSVSGGLSTVHQGKTQGPHADQVSYVLKRCLDNVKEGRAFAPSLVLIHRLIAAQPEARVYGYAYATSTLGPQTLTRNAIVEGFQLECDMLNLIVMQLLAYRVRAHAYAKKAKMDAAEIMGAQLVPPGRESYEDALTASLELLRFIVEHSSALLTSKQIEALWGGWFRQPGLLCMEEGELLFKWLADVVPSGDLHSASSPNSCEPTMAAETALSVFTALLCSPSSGMDMTHLGTEGYNCLESYFCSINSASRTISNAGSMNRSFLVVEKYGQLVGTDGVWAAFLMAEDADVARSAGEFLISLHLRLGAANIAERTEVSYSIVERCLQVIQGSLNGDQALLPKGCSGGVTVVRRAATLLKSFLEEVQAPHAPYGSSARPHSDESHVKVSVRRPVDGEHPVHVKELSYVMKKDSVTVGMLRARIAKEMRHPPTKVRVLNTSKQYLHAHSHDGVLLERAQAVHYCECFLLPSPAEDTEQYQAPAEARDHAWDTGTARKAPGIFISSSSERFGVLFNALSAGDQALAADVWSLIKLLPVNTDIHRDIATLGGRLTHEGLTGPVDWMVLLPPPSTQQSFLPLLYRVSTVTQLVEPFLDEYALPMDKAQATKWCQLFLEKGGLPHLLGLVMAESEVLDMRHSLSRACMASLLKLLAFFAVPGPLYNDKDELSEEGKDGRELPTLRSRIGMLDKCSGQNLGKLMERLLRIMYAVSRSVPHVAPGALLRPEASVVEDQPQYSRVRRRSSIGEEALEEREVKQLPPETEVMLHTMKLLVAFALYRPELLDVILAFPSLSSALHYSILEAPEVNVRGAVAGGVWRMARRLRGTRNSRDPVQHFLGLLISALPMVPQFSANSSAYFRLMSRLVRLPDSLPNEAKPPVCIDVAKVIASQPVLEDSEHVADPALQGHMRFLMSLLGSLGEGQEAAVIKQHIGMDLGLVDEVFSRCLFAPPHPHDATKAKGTGSNGSAPVEDVPLPKCKHPESRSLAFDLLAEMVKGCPPAHAHLCSLVAPHHHLGMTPEERDRKAAKDAKRERQRSMSGAAAAAASMRHGYGSASTVGPKLPSSSGTYLTHYSSKHKSGYCGLKNLGCICYMNSTLQQFFMVPEFRRDLLSIRAYGHGQGGDEANLQESMLWQLQKLFANLQESEKSYTNPQGFCHSFRDWEGAPTDVLVQQDASEFITIFFQQLEGLVMGTKWESLLKDSFGGVFSNELFADGGRYSERPEAFTFMSVNVRDIRSLYEALDDFIAGETVDYTWEDQDKDGMAVKTSLPTCKRISIKSLPAHLIIHLKRFEFDFETMTQIKINDRFEFPEKLNMRPYTKQNRRQEEGDMGPEVPAGAATDEGNTEEDSFYDYVLCGVVVHTGTATSGHYYSYIKERDGKGNWFEFNDTLVSDFDPAHLEAKCFGGEEGSAYGMPSYGSSNNVSGWSSKQRIHNAFMLVYDRVLRPGGVGDTGASGASSASSRPVAEGLQLARYRAPVEPSLMEEIWRQNMWYWRKKNLSGRPYYDFVGKIIKSAQLLDVTGVPSEEVLQLAVRFSLGMLLQAQEMELVSVWAQHLVEWLPHRPMTCSWLLGCLLEHANTLEELTDPSLEPRVRVDIEAVLRTAIMTSARATHGEAGQLTKNAPAVKFISQLLHAAMEPRRIRGEKLHFGLLQAFAQAGVAEQAHLLERGLCGNLMEEIIEEAMPSLASAATVGYTTTGGVSGLSPATMDDLFQLLLALVKGSLEAMPTKERAMLEGQDFLVAVVQHVRGPIRRCPAAALLAHMVQGNQSVTSRALEVALGRIAMGSQPEEIKPFFRGLMVLLVLVIDDLNYWRVESAMPRLMTTMAQERQHPTKREQCIEMLLRLAHMSPAVQGWLREHSEQLDWAIQLLQAQVDRSAGKFGGGTVGRGPRTSVCMQGRPMEKEWAVSSLEQLRALSLGDPLPSLCYNSDDEPEDLVGREIEVTWAKGASYKGKVTGYNSLNDMHHISYLDGDERDYKLSVKQWKL